jgi:hypothetical protein
MTTAARKPAPRRPAPKPAPATPTAPKGPAAGDVVTYRFTDTISGDQLTGHGVILRAGPGGVAVAPLSAATLHLPADAVTPATVPEV